MDIEIYTTKTALTAFVPGYCKKNTGLGGYSPSAKASTTCVTLMATQHLY